MIMASLSWYQKKEKKLESEPKKIKTVFLSDFDQAIINGPNNEGVTGHLLRKYGFDSAKQIYAIEAQDKNGSYFWQD